MFTQSQIQQFAFQFGFHAVGFARLQKDSQGFQLFQEWISKSYHGEMAYLERGLEKRGDPTLVLENAKSIITLAWDYSRGEVLSPFIARYAWGADYHLHLSRKLESLIEQLQQQYPAYHFKSYVDTGPVMEKYWASLSELGWIGKHTNLIHSERGSYFLLACLLTDLEIDPDTPTSDHCGRCTACIDVCPTRAIVAPYVLDARLCISYLTIELKGVIPPHLRPLIGTHVFGCDDCQEVCPWNRHARLPEEFLRDPPIDELLEYLALSEVEFKKRFQASPILRAKRRGFLRNVCVVLGNIKNPRAIPSLLLALEDHEALIRAHAAWALGQFQNHETLEVLRERVQNEAVAWVREEMGWVLKNL